MDCEEQLNSIKFYENTRKVNIFITIIIITIGIIGNGLAVFVFAQKKFRLHSSSIYLLCLCFCDGLFLLMHFFEDTLRTYIDVYLNDNTNSVTPECVKALGASVISTTLSPYSIIPQAANLSKHHMDNWLKLLNITDRFDFSCRLVNYLRYFLRFISAYIIIAFTIQRTFAIYSPFFQSKFESNRQAWLIVIILVIVGFILNLWVPFLFNPIQDVQTSIQYCDIKKEYSRAYFLLTIFYIALTMLIPIVVIFCCNILIIIYVLKAGKKREHMINMDITKKFKNPAISSYQSEEIRPLALQSKKSRQSDGLDATRNFSVSMTSIADNVSKKSLKLNATHSKHQSRRSESNRITRMLLLMSFSYAILNLPYFVSWCLFFYRMGIQKNYNIITKYYLFSAINLCEIFYVLNYGVHFFIYCASGQKFRQQLKNALSFSKK